MSIVPDIIAAFEGVGNTAEKTGTPQQTVSAWLARTPPEIPPWRRPIVAEAARTHCVKLSPEAWAYLASTARQPRTPTPQEAA